jgi:muconolactone delta-isomerase
MKFIALGSDTPSAKSSDFKPFLAGEAKRVWELIQEGIIREIFFRADRRDAVIFMECNSAGEAQKALSSLPLVENDLISFELIPLKPYDGLDLLFKSDIHR